METSSVRLPAEVWEALEDLYPDAQREEWLSRYVLSCARRRLTMRYYALKQAGYPAEIANEKGGIPQPMVTTDQAFEGSMLAGNGE